MEQLTPYVFFILQCLLLLGIAQLAQYIAGKLKKKTPVIDKIDKRLTNTYDNLLPTCGVMSLALFFFWLLPNMLETTDLYQISLVVRLTGIAMLVYISGRIILSKLKK